MYSKNRWILAVASVAAMPLAGAATYTVDDSGGANFLTIQAAIDAAAPGDVLRVFPGSYASFACSKPLVIVGEPSPSGLLRPKVAGVSSLNAIQGGTISGIEWTVLKVANCAGTVILDDDVTFGGGCDPSLEITNCHAVLISRGDLNGKYGDQFCETPAMRVWSSTVTISESNVRGGHGGVFQCDGYSGQPGIEVYGDSSLLVSRCTVVGGDGGVSTSFCGTLDSQGGAAILLNDPVSRAVVRGDASSYLQSGYGHEVFTGQNPQFPYSVTGSGRLTFSGESAFPDAFDVSSLTLPTPAEPFASLGGFDMPGSTKSFGLGGNVGGQYLLFVSFGAPSRIVVPGIAGSLYLAPSGPLVVMPLSTPVAPPVLAFDMQLPPSFAGVDGVIATFQVLETVGAPQGGMLALNARTIVIR